MPVATFVEHDFDPAVPCAGLQQVCAFRRQEFSVGRDALRNSFQQAVAREAIDLDVISLLEVTLWIGDAGRPLCVVGQQEQSLAGLVEPPDGGEEWEPGFRQALENGGAAVLVGGAGDKASRLVEHEIDSGFGAGLPAVHFDAIAIEGHRPGGIALHGAVYPNPSFLNQLHGLTSGAVAQF